jgi:hypothetical protein
MNVLWSFAKPVLRSIAPPSRAQAKVASEIMLSDVANWRLVAESRALPTV